MVSTDRDIINKVMERDDTWLFSKNRHRMRIPDCNLVTNLNLCTIFREERGTNMQIIGVNFIAFCVDDFNRTVLIQHNDITFVISNRTHIDILNKARVLNNNFRNLCDRRCCTTDMERTHRQLRAGFADGLCSNDTHCHAYFDRSACRKVAAIALGTHTVRRIARQTGTNPDTLNTRIVNNLTIDFIDFRIGRNNDLA